VRGSTEDFEIGSFTENDDIVTTGVNLNSQKLETIPKEQDDDHMIVSNSADSNTANKRTPPSHERCHWGTPECHYMATTDENSSDVNNKAAFRLASKGGGSIKNDIPSSLSSSNFLAQDSPAEAQSPPRTLSHKPPEGFILTAHVVTNPITGLANFAETIPSQRMIPFQECGAFGSSTEPIPMKQATFQHFPASAHPSTWNTFRQSKLIVALTRLEITVSGGKNQYNNSTHIIEEDNDEEEEGETRIFEPGDVILFEDFASRGHKIRAAPTSSLSEEGSKKDLSILILTPMISNHHSTSASATTTSVNSKSHGELKKHIKPFLSFILGMTSKSKQDIEKPCHWEEKGSLNHTTSEETLDRIESKEALLTHLVRPTSILQTITPRKVLLGTLGMTLSSGLAYFLSKVNKSNL